MKFHKSKIASAAAGFIVTATFGLSAPAFAEAPKQQNPQTGIEERLQTEIEKQIEAGQREPVLTRMTGAKSLEDLDESKDATVLGTTGDAMVMTLDQRITNHAEVISLRQDLGTEIQNRFNEDFILNQRIDNLLGTVGGQSQAIQRNRNMIGASQSDLNRIERRANDAYALGDDAMDRANQAYSLASTANTRAVNARNRADSAYNLAKRALDRPLGGGTGGGSSTEVRTKTYEVSRKVEQTCKQRTQENECTQNGVNVYEQVVVKAREVWAEGQCISRSSVKVTAFPGSTRVSSGYGTIRASYYPDRVYPLYLLGKWSLDKKKYPYPC